MNINKLLEDVGQVTADSYSDKDWFVYEHDKVFSKRISGMCMLREYTDVSDQGAIGSCVANAVCDAFEIIDKTGVNLSRMFLYWTSRYDPLKKTGATIRTTLDAVRNYGIPNEEVWPYDINKFNIKPSDVAFENASRNKRMTFYRVKSEADVISSIESGYPVVFGIPVDSRMFNSKKESEYIYDGSNLTSYQHALIVVGYRTVEGKIQFRIRNSWGKNWGDNGYCWFTSNYLLGSMIDAWSITNYVPKESLMSRRNLFFIVGTLISMAIITFVLFSNASGDQRIAGIIIFLLLQIFTIYKRWWLSEEVIERQSL